MGRKPLRAISSATLREDGPELGRLLASLEAVLPLREPSGLGAPAMRAHVLGRSEGTTGEIVAVLTAPTDAALLADEERIVDATLDAAEYQRRACAGAYSSASCDDAALGWSLETCFEDTDHFDNQRPFSERLNRGDG